MTKRTNFGVIQIEGMFLCLLACSCQILGFFHQAIIFWRFIEEAVRGAGSMTFLGLNCVFGAQDDLKWVRGLLEEVFRIVQTLNLAILGQFWS